MKALKMTVTIGRDRKLVIDVPESFREGRAELILLASDEPDRNPKTSLETHIQQLLKHSRNRSRSELDREIEMQRKSWE
ncbi:MAG: hypothetical protein O2954_04315 [bacterium]|nr:hypothetical protein [bacterium]